MEDREKMRKLPAIDRLLTAMQGKHQWQAVSRKMMIEALRQSVESAREQLLQGREAEISVPALVNQAEERIKAVLKPGLRRVINATGVVLHTNLGRAPLGKRAVQAVEDVMAGYSTLEYNVDSGERGSRYSYIAERICDLLGCEDALVVNNNAAAVLLVLSALAREGEVIVSRGELVEIGGSFRVPDVMKQSGAKLVEVGTTNKTHLGDYQAAMTDNTAAILKVHTSNYRIIGFTEQVEAAALVRLAGEKGIPIIEDLGSGTLVPITAGSWHEPSAAERLAAGIDVVTFSGDKLLGAGQSGIIAGKKCYLDKMKKHPLLRAVRVDKLTLAALEGTLLTYQTGNPMQEIPVQRFLRADPGELKHQAEQLVNGLLELKEIGWQLAVVPLESQGGGGSLPGVGLKGYGVSLRVPEISAASLERRFRLRRVPIITRIQAEQVIIDVRCLSADDRAEIQQACRDIGRGEE